MCGLISGLSIMFHWFMCLYLCQYLWGFLFIVMDLGLLHGQLIWAPFCSDSLWCYVNLSSMWGMGQLGAELSSITFRPTFWRPRGLRGPVSRLPVTRASRGQKPTHWYSCPSQVVLCKGLQQFPQNKNFSLLHSANMAGAEACKTTSKIFHILMASTRTPCLSMEWGLLQAHMGLNSKFGTRTQVSWGPSAPGAFH